MIVFDVTHLFEIFGENVAGEGGDDVLLLLLRVDTGDAGDVSGVDMATATKRLVWVNY